MYSQLPGGIGIHTKYKIQQTPTGLNHQRLNEIDRSLKIQQRRLNPLIPSNKQYAQASTIY